MAFLDCRMFVYICFSPYTEQAQIVIDESGNTSQTECLNPKITYINMNELRESLVGKAVMKQIGIRLTGLSWKMVR